MWTLRSRSRCKEQGSFESANASVITADTMAWYVLSVNGGGSIGCLVGHRSGAQGPIRHEGAVKPSQSPRDGSPLRSIEIAVRQANKPQPQPLTQRYLHPAGAAGLCPLDFISKSPFKNGFSGAQPANHRLRSKRIRG